MMAPISLRSLDRSYLSTGSPYPAVSTSLIEGETARVTMCLSTEEIPRLAMSEEHKQALAQGRREARAIKRYMKALDSRKPGRPVTKESLESRLAKTVAKIESEDNPLKRVELVQNKLDIEDQLAAIEETADFERLETDFIEHVKPYSERKRITYTAWRECGVPAATLRAAGVPETRRR